MPKNNEKVSSQCRICFTCLTGHKYDQTAQARHSPRWHRWWPSPRCSHVASQQTGLFPKYHVDIMLISWSVSTSFKMFHVSKCFETSWVVQKMPKKCQEHTLPDPACISASSPCSSHLTELGSPEPALRPELDAKYMEIPSPQSINKLWWASDELTVSYSVLSLSQERSRSTEFTKRHAQVHPSYLLVFDSSC